MVLLGPPDAARHVPSVTSTSKNVMDVTVALWGSTVAEVAVPVRETGGPDAPATVRVSLTAAELKSATNQSACALDSVGKGPEKDTFPMLRYLSRFLHADCGVKAKNRLAFQVRFVPLHCMLFCPGILHEPRLKVQGFEFNHRRLAVMNFPLCLAVSNNCNRC